MKRPLSSPPEEAQARACLDFEAWKVQQATSVCLRRDDDSVYDPIVEHLPDDPWYALDHGALRQKVIQMCDLLAHPVVNCKIDDPQIADLIRSLVKAKKIPHPKKVNIAVVGNQGVGKSSTLNALLNRDLVDASASSSACTTFATIIQYKDGAADNTNESDLKVTFLEVDEIRDFIEEHVRRYADVYSPQEPDVTTSRNERDLTAVDDIGDDNVSECDLSDSDMSEASESPIHSKKPRKKVSKAVQLAADTAEQFFRIIFNAHRNEEKETELQIWLNEPELEDGRFLDHCVKLATEHLAQIQAEEQGSVEYSAVKDSDLQTVRNHATTLWPLVKAVTISTGSVLLRNGLCFMDLPGYGDLNQTRSAVVNEYRRKAHFEIVIAKSDRYLSKTDEDRFLHRAIRHHEAKNVFLVLNKADSCLETPQHQVIRMLKEETSEPFATIRRHLSGIKGLTGESREMIQQYRRYLIREAQMADGRREVAKIRLKMHKKGVQVFAVSSARYLDWLDPSPLEDPPFDPEGTGIPFLRRCLLKLPAETNYRELRYHFFETVTDIEDKVSRILMKFTNDIDTATMRSYLVEHLPNLDATLRSLSASVPVGLVPEAWNDVAMRKVADGLEKHLRSLPDDDVAYQTFWLMLRNNGFASHGRYAGKNLNDEFLQTYKLMIKSWKNKAAPKARNVEAQLNDPVQATLNELRQCLYKASSDIDLKRRVAEALDKLTRRIAQSRSSLFEQLEAATDEIYKRFTTEDDIKCPIAVALKKAYSRINVIRMHLRRRPGIYREQREELIRTVTESNNRKDPLVAVISRKVKMRLCEQWQSAGEDFITVVLGHFEEFTQALSELLENEIYMLEEHRLMREELGQQLLSFSMDLGILKGQFVEVEIERAAKKACITVVKHEEVE